MLFTPTAPRPGIIYDPVQNPARYGRVTGTLAVSSKHSLSAFGPPIHLAPIFALASLRPAESREAAMLEIWMEALWGNDLKQIAQVGLVVIEVNMLGLDKGEDSDVRQVMTMEEIESAPLPVEQALLNIIEKMVTFLTPH